VKVSDLGDVFDSALTSGQEGMNREVTGGYCGDLLSDVMGNASAGDAWMTVQTHQNIVAVAVLREIACIVLVNDHRPDEETKSKAEAEGIPILLTSLSAFQVAGRIYAAGIGTTAE
jgi:predicted transcriptional regulator